MLQKKSNKWLTVLSFPAKKCSLSILQKKRGEFLSMERIKFCTSSKFFATDIYICTTHEEGVVFRGHFIDTTQRSIYYVRPSFLKTSSAAQCALGTPTFHNCDRNFAINRAVISAFSAKKSQYLDQIIPFHANQRDRMTL